MELALDNLTVIYDNYYDHDIFEAKFMGTILNDLTMWPKTIKPKIWRREENGDKKHIFDDVNAFSESLAR